MRKVSKGLLVTGFAALVMSACQDSVSIVQPAPPPPPPPPATVEASVTIQGLRTIPGNAPVNPTMVMNDINVVLNVDEGTETVTQVDLLLDGVAIGCQQTAGNVAPGEGVSLSAASDVIECFFDSDAVAGACVGDQLAAAIDNGDYTLGARITTSESLTRDASNDQAITIGNSDFIVVAHNQGQAIVSGGVTYFGGPEDLDGDGTDDNVNSFAACPVSYNGTVVASMGLQATNGFTAPLDLGSGLGVTDTDTSTPFVWVVDSGDNSVVEDDVNTNGLTAGQTVSTAGIILDENALNVTAQFAGTSMGPLFFDFLAPQPNTGGVSEVTLDGGSFAASTWYSAGDFGLSFVAENGVGWSFGNGASVDVGDCSDADNNDADPSTGFVTVVAGAMAMSDHPEDDWELGGDGFAGADAGGLDCYQAELQALADDLGNAFDLTGLATTIQSLNDYGADFTEPAVTNPRPDATVTVFNPSDISDFGTCVGPLACTMLFDASDPDLVSGDPGSGIDETACNPCNAMINLELVVTPGGGNDGEDMNVVLAGPPGEYIIDFTASPSGATIPLVDGDYEMLLTLDDLATPANTGSYTWTFNLDDTPPTHGALNPAPVGAPGGTQAVGIVMTIGGTIDDANIIDTATLEIYDSTNGTCNDGDDVLLSEGSAAGEVDDNSRDLENGTNAVAFNETFTVQGPATASRPVTQRVCWLISAEDEAVLRDGTDTGNSSMLATGVDIAWNP